MMITLLINNNTVEKLVIVLRTCQVTYYSLLTILVLISGILSFYYIIQVFRSRTDNILNDSKIYFKDISNKDYITFKKSIENIKTNELKEELISQIYVNSRICDKKYSYFNKALICFIVCIVAFFLLHVILLMG